MMNAVNAPAGEGLAPVFLGRGAVLTWLVGVREPVHLGVRDLGAVGERLHGFITAKGRRLSRFDRGLLAAYFANVYFITHDTAPAIFIE
jgi:hypothetical protein